MAGITSSDLKDEIVSRHRYPYGNRLFIVDLLTLTAGASVLLTIPHSELQGLQLAILVSAPILFGAILTYLLKRSQLAKLRYHEGNHQHQVILHIIGLRNIRRRAIKNVILILLVLGVPVALSFVLSPIVWVLLLLSSFVSFVTGRLAFFLGIRLWESRGNLYLQTFVSRRENPNGSICYVEGILIDEKLPKKVGIA